MKHRSTTKVQSNQPDRGGRPQMVLKNVTLSPAIDHVTAGEKMEFDLCNVDNSFANALRRVMLAEIPTLAIDTVIVRANTSVFFDEMIVHRLAMVPWDSITAKDWTAEDEIVIDFKVRCGADTHSRKVTSADLPCGMFRGTTEVRPIAAPKSDGIWLFTLGRGQEFDARCVIRRGIAKLHAKWMAVSTVAMRYAADFSLNDQGFAALTPELRQKWVELCPRKVFGHDGTKIAVVDKAACIFCKECMTTDGPFAGLPAPLCAVRQQKNALGQFEFHFTIESTGQLPVVEVVRQAVTVLRRKLEDIRSSLKEAQQGSSGVPATRPIGIAATTARVSNEDYAPRGRDDDLSFLQQ